MRRTTTIAFTILAFCLFASVSYGAIFLYNVDSQTLPGGPVDLVTESSPDLVSGTNDVYTFHFGAHNTGDHIQPNVDFLLQFAYDPSIALTFNDGTDTWSGGGNTLSYPGLSAFSMSATNAPLLWTKTSPTRTGTLLTTDTVPYVPIGDINAGATIPFDLVVQVTSGFNNFAVVGSFVALPEPSTIALLGMGALGLLVARRRSRG